MMTHDILRPTFTRNDERGVMREILNEGHWESILQGEHRAGAVMGNHYHKETEVFFFLLTGRVSVITESVESQERDDFILNPLEGVILHPNESHRLTFEEAGSYIMLKSKQYDPVNPDTFHYPIHSSDS